MWVWTSMLLMLLPALLAGRVLRIAPVTGEDRRKLLHDVGEVKGFPVQLVLAAVADPEERVLLVGQATALEDQADGVRRSLRRMGRVRREEEDLTFADGDVVGFAVFDDSQYYIALYLVKEFFTLVDVIVGARVRAADHGDHEVAVAFPDLRITDGRLEQVAMLVDPFAKVERRELHGSLHGGDALQLDGDGRGEAGDLHRRAAGRILREVFRPEAVVRREVALHVGEEDGHVDEPLPTGARLLEDVADVVEDGAALRLDVVGGDRAVGREADAGDLLRALLARADAGEEEEVPHLARVGKMADGVRCSCGDDARGHSFTHTFLGSEKKRSASRPPSRPIPDSFMPPNGVRRSRISQQLTQTTPLWSCAATRWARLRSRVQREAESP